MAAIKRTASSGMKIMGTGMSVETANFLSFWGNWILLAALIVGAVSTGVVIVAGIVKDRGFEEYKLGVAAQVAEAKKEGIEAGKAASGALVRAAEANERSTKLEHENLRLRLELAQRTSPLVDRRLKPDQMDLIAKELAGSGVRIVVVAPSSDREVQAYAEDFREAFSRANVLMGITFSGSMLTSSKTAGRVDIVPEDVNIPDQPSPSRTRVEAALAKAGIKFGHKKFGAPNGPELPISLVGGDNIVEITIGVRSGLSR